MGFLAKFSMSLAVGVAGYGAIYYGHQMMVPDYPGKEDLTGKTILVTGANSGIGRATALGLAARNAKLILGCRNQDSCIWVRREIAERTKNENIFCSNLDLASLQSIKEFTQRMQSKDIHFDVIINNAGVMRCPKTYTKEGFEMQLGVNHLAHFYLTHLLLDDLKTQKEARVVNVVSESYKKASINFDDLNSFYDYDPAKAYSQSKLANVLFTTELASRLKGSNVKVFSADPGVCNTKITRHMGVDKSLMGKIFAKPFLKLFGRSPEKGAQVILYCALSPELSNEEASGKLYRDNKAIQYAPNVDNVTAVKLWLVSDRWTVNRDSTESGSMPEEEPTEPTSPS